MIATAPQHTEPNNKPIMIGVLLLLGVLGGILLGSHATERHGTDAQVIRECLEQNGPSQVWQDRERPDVQVFCVEVEQDGCTKIGIMIAQLFPRLGKCTYKERTSFFPSNGSGAKGDPERVRRYLEKFADLIEGG